MTELTDYADGQRRDSTLNEWGWFIINYFIIWNPVLEMWGHIEYIDIKFNVLIEI